MYKKLLILLIEGLFITGCGNQVFACSLQNNDAKVDINISSFNDDIKSINVRTSYILPVSLINDSIKFADFKKQLDDSYHFENDNILVREYDALIDSKYSLAKTIEYLQKENFYCE